MSAVLRQTHASPVIGPQCRARWCWEGEAFTGYGAWVPKEVLAADDQLVGEGLPLPADDEVLDDLTPILSASVLPPGAVLAEPPPKIDKAKLAAIRERLVASAAAADANALPAPAGLPAALEADPAGAIELAVARRQVNERDEQIAAAANENEELRRRMAALEARLAAPPANPVTPDVTTPGTPADPLSEATGSAGAKKAGNSK